MILLKNNDFSKKNLHFLKFWQVSKCILINMNQIIPRQVPENSFIDQFRKNGHMKFLKKIIKKLFLLNDPNLGRENVIVRM